MYSEINKTLLESDLQMLLKNCGRFNKILKINCIN